MQVGRSTLCAVACMSVEWHLGVCRCPKCQPSRPPRAQVDLLFDSTCDRIRAAAAGKKIPLPDALMPCGMPLQAMYHVNFSGAPSDALLALSFHTQQEQLQRQAML